MEPYNETTDPIDHLKNFRSLMLLQGANDAILYRAFSLTLRKEACHWYSNMQPNSMDSFHQLSQIFVAHFVSSHRQCHNSDFLVSIKQKDNEPLWNYINRFNAATLEVQNLDQSVAMTALKVRLLQNDLLFSLNLNYPKNFTKVLERAERYAQVDEAWDWQGENFGGGLQSNDGQGRKKDYQRV
ncbi:uncharacterized protein [Elaeis guineensis]|uniref:uncharacterized protein n=1 Tax=Elaeis guineensis var. tenera TaxID=51953 RepID=UPI003C6CE78C